MTRDVGLWGALELKLVVGRLDSPFGLIRSLAFDYIRLRIRMGGGDSPLATDLRVLLALTFEEASCMSCRHAQLERTTWAPATTLLETPDDPGLEECIALYNHCSIYRPRNWVAILDAFARRAAISWALFRERDSAPRTATSAALTPLQAINRRSKLLWYPSFAECTRAIADDHALWRQPLETWQVTSPNPGQQFVALVQHVYQLPQFIAVGWLRDIDQCKAIGRHLTAGGEVKTAPSMPIVITGKVATEFLNAPGDYTVGAAIRWAQCKAAGTDRHSYNVAASKLASDFSNEHFARRVIAFFARHNEDIHHVWTSPIIEMLLEENTQTGSGDRIDGQLIRSRDPIAVKARVMSNLSRYAVLFENGSQAGWEPMFFPFRLDYPSYQESIAPGQSWQVVELLVLRQLAQDPVVLAYSDAATIDRTANGIVSLLSLRRITEGDIQYCLAIEVSRSERVILRMRGPDDRYATPEERAVIERWAAVDDLSLTTRRREVDANDDIPLL